jgi:hypothetical protein
MALLATIATMYQPEVAQEGADWVMIQVRAVNEFVSRRSKRRGVGAAPGWFLSRQDWQREQGGLCFRILVADKPAHRYSLG